MNKFAWRNLRRMIEGWVRRGRAKVSSHHSRMQLTESTGRDKRVGVAPSVELSGPHLVAANACRDDDILGAVCQLVVPG
jgi:hypothetical protein